MTDRGSQEIEWDAENRPVKITTNGTVTEFVYDGDGNRVRKTVSGGDDILYMNRYYEKNLTSGNITTSYYLGNRLIAQMESDELRFIHQDHLTGTALMTSENGISLGVIKYYPYGATRSGDVPTDKLFTGQRYDDTGLYYYGARYYDPEIGRFISPDPTIPDGVYPQSYNRYSYCINNPLKHVDPDGKDYLLIGGSGSKEKDMLKWKLQVENALCEDGEEKVYILWDNDPENVAVLWTRFDVNPRLDQVDSWLSNPVDANGDPVTVTNLKIVGHSEGAATTGVYMDKYLDGSSDISQRSRDLLDSQLRGVFLVDCVTGISAIKGANYTYRDIEDVGDRLSYEKQVKAASIYNGAGPVYATPLSGWKNINVASWNDYLRNFFIPGGYIFSIAYNHSSAKYDALPKIKTEMGG